MRVLHCGSRADWVGTVLSLARPRPANSDDAQWPKPKAPAARPLSPHLQIYRPMLTMMMSIVHRITGVGLYFGTLLVAWWLIAAAGPTAMRDSNGSPVPGSAG